MQTLYGSANPPNTVGPAFAYAALSLSGDATCSGAFGVGFTTSFPGAPLAAVTTSACAAVVGMRGPHSASLGPFLPLRTRTVEASLGGYSPTGGIKPFVPLGTQVNLTTTAGGQHEMVMPGAAFAPTGLDGCTARRVGAGRAIARATLASDPPPPTLRARNAVLLFLHLQHRVSGGAGVTGGTA